MRLILLFLIAVSNTFCAFGQQEPVSFTDAIKPHLNKYNLQSDLEFERGNIDRGEKLFDSLVQNYLVGSRFENYAFKNIGGGKTKLAKVKKPIFIITYASWCVMNKGEIPALNKLSKKYSKDVQFIVLFWDKKENVRRIGKKFAGNIKVCYANEAYRNDSRIVSALKHTLGFPTSFYLNSSLGVVDIRRGGVPADHRMSYINAFNLNYNLFESRLASFMLKKDSVISQLAVTE